MQSSKENTVIEINEVSKKIGKNCVLDSINLTVPTGMVYGITGHNGAGKSILLRVIAGLVRPTNGLVRVFGEAIGKEREFPRDIGVLIETPGFLSHYSGFMNLNLLAKIRNKVTQDEITTIINKVGLDPKDTRPVRTYSSGMRQRLGLAQALMERPQLLLLDEPTNALDRDGTILIHQLIKEQQESGVTILLTSHNRGEIETLCDASFEMDRGRLLEGVR